MDDDAVNTLKDSLYRELGRLGGHEQQLSEAERQLVERASRQLDTMPRALATADAFQAGTKPGILLHRRHRTLLSERARLAAIVEGRGRPPGDPPKKSR